MRLRQSNESTGVALMQKPERPINPFALPPEPTQKDSVYICGVTPESGASTWATILGLPEITSAELTDQGVLFVLRSTVKSLKATLGLIAELRSKQVALLGILVVPDAPGAYPKPVKNLLTILSGPNSVIEIPWVEDFRAIEFTQDLLENKGPKKAVTKVRETIEKRIFVSL